MPKIPKTPQIVLVAGGTAVRLGSDAPGTSIIFQAGHLVRVSNDKVRASK